MNTREASKNPRVSVIIPVRDCIDYVREALDSVLSQSFADFELLLVDDGSKDADYRQFEEIDERVRVIRLEGLGVSGARNVGLSQASGDLIAFLDADDVWFPGKLKSQVDYMQSHPEVGVVFGAFQKWESAQDGRFLPSSRLMSDCGELGKPELARSGWLYSRLLMGLLVGMNTAMIRRSLVDAIGGFNISFRQAEDYDFWLKASRISEMHALDGQVALYRIHPASAMHQLAQENALLIVLRAAQLRWGLEGPGNDSISSHVFQRRIAQIHFDHGYAHFWKGDISVARRAFRNSLSLGFRSRRSAAYLALSCLPFKMGRWIRVSAD